MVNLASTESHNYLLQVTLYKYSIGNCGVEQDALHLLDNWKEFLKSLSKLIGLYLMC